MKWYIWLALGLVLVFIIWFATKKSKSVVTTSDNQLALQKASSTVFNPWEITKIS